MNKEDVEKIVSEAKSKVTHDNVHDFRVLNDHCIVAPVSFDEKNTNGVVKPKQYEDKNEYGVILATGPGRVTENGVHITPDLKQGQVVLYGQYSYTQLRVDGVDLNLIRHDDIIAVLPH